MKAGIYFSMSNVTGIVSSLLSKSRNAFVSDYSEEDNF